MKLFIRKALLFGFSVVAVIALLVLVVPANTDAYLYAYENKCKLLEETPSPRIIFIGGSNLAFGLDSKRIKDSLHVNVVNAGLHAGIGMKYMVDDIALYAREGDVLIFAPEYAHFYGDGMNGEPLTLSGLMAIDGFGKTDLLNTAQWINVICGVPSDLFTRIVPQKDSPYIYKASNFNEYGDEVEHWQLPNRAVHPERINKEFNNTMSRYFTDKLKEIETRNKAKVIVIPPVCIQTYYDANRQNAQRVSDFLQQEGFPFAIGIEECVMHDDCAYDTPYHVNKKGVDRRTETIIKFLKKAL